MSKVKEKMSFEEALEKIEEIISKLENKNLDLETSLKEFSLGVDLINECNKKLEDAKRKINLFLVEGDKEILWENWKE